MEVSPVLEDVRTAGTVCERQHGIVHCGNQTFKIIKKNLQGKRFKS